MPRTNLPKGSHHKGFRDTHSFLSYVSLAFQSSVLDDVWGQLVFFTLYATVITLADRLTSANLSVNNVMLSILGSLLGFVVSLRTSSAYERFQDGRRIWSMIFQNARNLSAIVWLHVKDETPPEPEASAEGSSADGDKTLSDAEVEARKLLEEEYTVRNLIEKRTILGLIEAFAIASKHYCRGESGVFYDDLYHLVAFLPKHAFPSLIEKQGFRPDPIPLWHNSHSSGKRFIPVTPGISRANSLMDSTTKSRCATPPAITLLSEKPDGERPPHLRRASTTIDLLPSRMPPKRKLEDHVPLIAWIKNAVYLLFCCGIREKVEDEETIEINRRLALSQDESNVPLEIYLFLSSYIASVDRRALLSGPILAAANNYTQGLHDSLCQLERLVSSGLPWAYMLHLRMTVSLFLFTVPFQVVAQLGYFTIIGQFLASLFFLGFLEIGNEIEQPFDYGKNDVDLDHLCAVLQKELAEIISHPAFEPSDFVFDPLNRPFFTAGDGRSAPEIMRSFSPDTSEVPTMTGSTLASVQMSLSSHFKHAARHAAVSATKTYRHKAKKAPLHRVEVDYAE